MMGSITLNWEGPYALKDFLTKYKEYEKPGVYFWISPDELGVQNISYIGKSESSIRKRMIEHYRNLIAGLYTMLPHERINSKKEWRPDTSLPNVIKVITCEEKYIEIIKDGFKLANDPQTSTIYVATLEKDKTKHVERQLLFDIKPSGTKWGTKTEPPNPITIKHKASSELQSLINLAKARLTNEEQ